MPGDLDDKEQWQPFHHDKLYEPGRNTFEPGSNELECYLQGLAREVDGRSLSRDDLKELCRKLDERGFLGRPWGDESFRDEVLDILNKMKLVRKMVSKCQTLIIS